ncbi:beta-galactoside-binding lectin-like [Paramormyrops kingsleyae]|uniref:beta-galactoside-binding lectin-like n=1 Tax=Paramormyrops kingsleyae TaxID=1676925 RepID=UPI003B96BE4B
MALTVQNMSVKAGERMKITGVPKPKAEGFTINLGYSKEDITLDFSFTQDNVCTLKFSGRETIVPIKRGVDFEIYISLENKKYIIEFPNKGRVSHPNDFHYEKFAFISVRVADVRIKGFNIEP